MYCPNCGVNNDRGESRCYICEKPLPSIEAIAPPVVPGRQQARRTVAAAEKPATVGDRTLALLFDRILLAAIFGAAAVPTMAGMLPSRMELPSTRAITAGIAAFLLLPFVYHLLLETVFKTTVGKAMMGLQIRTLPGRSRFAAAFLRNILRIIDGLACYLVGFLTAMFTTNGQRVGDLVAGTVVMERPVGNLWRAVIMILWLAAVAGAGWWVWLAVRSSSL